MYEKITGDRSTARLYGRRSLCKSLNTQTKRQGPGKEGAKRKEGEEREKERMLAVGLVGEEVDRLTGDRVHRPCQLFNLSTFKLTFA